MEQEHLTQYCSCSAENGTLMTSLGKEKRCHQANMHLSGFSFAFLTPLRLSKLVTSNGSTLHIKMAKWLNSLVGLSGWWKSDAPWRDPDKTGKHWPLWQEFSLYCCMEHLVSHSGITEEPEFAGQQLHLHRHSFILLVVNAEGSLSALCTENSVDQGSSAATLTPDFTNRLQRTPPYAFRPIWSQQQWDQSFTARNIFKSLLHKMFPQLLIGDN